MTLQPMLILSGTGAGCAAAFAAGVPPVYPLAFIAATALMVLLRVGEDREPKYTPLSLSDCESLVFQAFIELYGDEDPGIKVNFDMGRRLDTLPPYLITEFLLHVEAITGVHVRTEETQTFADVVSVVYRIKGSR